MPTINAKHLMRAAQCVSNDRENLASIVIGPQFIQATSGQVAIEIKRDDDHDDEWWWHLKPKRRLPAKATHVEFDVVTTTDGCEVAIGSVRQLTPIKKHFNIGDRIEVIGHVLEYFDVRRCDSRLRFPDFRRIFENVSDVQWKKGRWPIRDFCIDPKKLQLLMLKSDSEPPRLQFSGGPTDKIFCYGKGYTGIIMPMRLQ